MITIKSSKAAMAQGVIRVLALAGVVGLLLVGCNGAERERRAESERQRLVAAARERQVSALVSRCRNQQKAVQQELKTINSSKAELTRLSLQRYLPQARPTAPDPALLERLTRDDKELVLERHAEAMARWRQDNGAAQRRWEAEQQAQRRQLSERQQQALAALNVLGVAASAEAQTAWSRCDGEQLAALALR